MISHDLMYLQRCTQLANLATSEVKDNPRVGAVLVYNHRIIGEGYHIRAGQAHAEVNCLASVQADDRHLIDQSTLYVSLEPCCVEGRTGACTDLIQKENIPVVVVGQLDASPGVNGKGIEILTRAGIEVRSYPDFEPAKAVYLPRHMMVTRHRPYIILKYAQSQDGYLRPADRSASYWISNAFSRRKVHLWRTRMTAIVVGGRTVIEDNPSLTTRYGLGPDALAVIVDLRNRCTGQERVFTDGRTQRPLLFSSSARPDIDAEVIVVTDQLADSLPMIFEELLQRRCGYVMIEGGATLLSACFAGGWWDEARIFTGSQRMHAGISAPDLPERVSLSYTEHIGQDLLQVFKAP